MRGLKAPLKSKNMKKMIEFDKYTTINKVLHALKHVLALNFRHIVIEYV